jgi:hypothetical protein
MAIRKILTKKKMKTYMLAAPPPPEPAQPINWQETGVVAIRNPISPLNTWFFH